MTLRYSWRFLLAPLAVLSLSTLGAAASTLDPIRIAVPPADDVAGESSVLAPETRRAAPARSRRRRLRPPPHDDGEGEDALAAANSHRERSGRWATYEQIPRRPIAQPSYDAYRYPIPPGSRAGTTS